MAIRSKVRRLHHRYRLNKRRKAGRERLGLYNGVRLNVGCGDKWIAGWVNIDYRKEVSDMVASVGSLPLRDGCAMEILAEDVLEHVWRDDAFVVLDEFRRVLRADGSLTLKVPNLTALAEAILAHPSEDAYVRNVYGGHRWGPNGLWDTHHWGWTPASLELDLQSTGFTVAHNDCALNMTVTAKPI